MNSLGRYVPNMLPEKSREITPERMKRWNQSKNSTQLWLWLVIEAKSDGIEQYCIGIWNVRSMNQGKLEVVKEEMARVNMDILGIRELKWMEWANLIQMTMISTSVGKNPL